MPKCLERLEASDALSEGNQSEFGKWKWPEKAQMPGLRQSDRW